LTTNDHFPLLSVFRRVSVPYFRARLLRMTLTVVGIALGVAGITGVQLLHGAVSRSFEQTVERIAGKAVLQVTNGEIGVPEELVDELRAIPAAGAVAPSVQGYLPVSDLLGERLYIFGIDLLSDQELREHQLTDTEGYVDDPLLFIAQPDSVALTDEFLEEHDFALDDRVRVGAPTGRVDLVIRAKLDVRKGPATLFDGRLAVMDVFAAQRLFALRARFHQIDLGLKEGHELHELEAAVKRVVGQRGAVERPLARGDTLEHLLAGNRYALSLVAVIALIVGCYVVFNTMIVAVAERRRHLALLRVLGTRRRDVLRLVTLEALLLGLAGSILGAPLGIALAKAMAGSLASTVESLYMPVALPEITFASFPILGAMSIGAVATVVAVVVPAYEATRVQPLQAIGLWSLVEGTTTGKRRKWAALGTGALVLALVLCNFRGRLPMSESVVALCATLLVFGGMSLIAPTGIRILAGASEGLVRRMTGFRGLISVRNLHAYIDRVAVSCSALVVGIAGAIGVATLIASMERTMDLWLDVVLLPNDLAVNVGHGSLSLSPPPLPSDLGDEMEALPEVLRVDGERYVKLFHEGTLIQLVALDSDVYRDGHRTFSLVEGDPSRAAQALSEGGNILVNEVFLRQFEVSPGQTIHLRSPTGDVPLRIAAVNFDLGDMPRLTLDRAFYRQRWRDDTVSFFNPVLRADVDAQRVIDAIRRQWGEKYGLSVVTSEGLRHEHEVLLDQVFALIYPLVALAIGVSLIGMTNSLLASVLDRVRHNGILRACGATAGQVTQLVMVESCLIGCLGALLAVPLGLLVGYLQVTLVLRGLFGMTVFGAYPVRIVLFTALASAVLSLLAGYLPGRATRRFTPTQALAYE